MSRQRGFALLIVLWSVVLLTLLVTGITATGRSEVQLAQNLRGAAVAEAAADGAVWQAAFHLVDPAAPWAADGTGRVLRIAGARVSVRIDNEAGKVNPNTAQPPLLAALIQQAGLDGPSAMRLALAIATWRFPGSTAANAAAYRGAGLDYAPPGAPFESVDEVGAVLGMTPALLAALRPSLSVYNDSEPVLQVAGPAVLVAMRAVTGDVPRPGPLPPLRTVSVTALAETANGSRAGRRAVLRIGGTPSEPPIRVLDWSLAN